MDPILIATWLPLMASWSKCMTIACTVTGKAMLVSAWSNSLKESLLQKKKRGEGEEKQGNVTDKTLKKELQETQNVAPSVRWGKNYSAPVMQHYTRQNFIQLICS